MAAETAAARYARDYGAALALEGGETGGGRVTRTLLTQPEERWSRLYVDENGDSAVEGDIA